MKPELYNKIREHFRKGLEEKGKNIPQTKKEKSKNRILTLINKAYAGTLTDKEKKEFLSIDEKMIPTPLQKELYHWARINVTTGSVEKEVSEKLRKNYRSVQIPLERDPEKIQKEIEERSSKGGIKDEREI